MREKGRRVCGTMLGRRDGAEELGGAKSWEHESDYMPIERNAGAEMVTVWPDRHDVQIVIERIKVFEGRIEVKPKADMDAVLGSAEMTEASILREQSKSKNPALDSSTGSQNDRNRSAADVSDASPSGSRSSKRRFIVRTGFLLSMLSARVTPLAQNSV